MILLSTVDSMLAALPTGVRPWPKATEADTREGLPTRNSELGVAVCPQLAAPIHHAGIKRQSGSRPCGLRLRCSAKSYEPSSKPPIGLGHWKIQAFGPEAPNWLPNCSYRAIDQRAETLSLSERRKSPLASAWWLSVFVAVPPA
jgi:hypothetical protein